MPYGLYYHALGERTVDMHWLGVAFELVGGFFLAVEAIKTSNLVLLGQKAGGIAAKIRRFKTADEFSFQMIGGLISIGVLALMVILNFAVSTPAVMVIQLVSALSLIILTLVLERIAKGLEWIERNTASGVVGIAGFLLYAVGIIIREVT
jgi:hypothetical protein